MGQAAHCEVATNLTARLGLGTTLRSALPAMMERWDGKGQPGRLSGDQIPVSVRLANLAQDSAVWLRVGGIEAAIATARRRAGRAHDPALVEALVEHPAILADLDDGASWDGSAGAARRASFCSRDHRVMLERLERRNRNRRLSRLIRRFYPRNTSRAS